jgi:hypothetical protein
LKLDKSIDLTLNEKEKIKNRSNIMARQFFPGIFYDLKLDKDEEFIQGQLSNFLSSLKIANNTSKSSFNSISNSNEELNFNDLENNINKSFKNFESYGDDMEYENLMNEVSFF